MEINLGENGGFERKRVSPKVLIVWMFRWVAFLFLLYVIVGFFEDNISAVEKLGLSSVILKASLIILGLLFIYDYLKYNGLRYSLTERGIYIEKGIFKKTHYLAPYEGIQDIDIERGLLERLLGIGTVIVETGGISQRKIEEDYLQLPGIEDPYRFARAIIDKVGQKKKLEEGNLTESLKKVEKLETEISQLKDAIEGLGNILEMQEEKIKEVEELAKKMHVQLVKTLEYREETKKIREEMEEIKNKTMDIEKSLAPKTEGKGKKSTTTKASKRATKATKKKGSTKDVKTKKSKSTKGKSQGRKRSSKKKE